MDSRTKGTQESNPETKSIRADSPNPCPQNRMDLSATCLARIPGSENSMGLFDRLPRELRDMIYEEVLGNQFLYISWFQPRRGNGYFGIADRSARRNGKLALLKTCRDIYIEAIPIFYSTNTFAFGFNMRTNTPLGFFHAIPPQYLGIITSICVSYDPYSRLTEWYPSERKENWIRMWTTIATAMPMLKDVTAKFGGSENWSQYFRETESEPWEEWFQSIELAAPQFNYRRLKWTPKDFEFKLDRERTWENLKTLLRAIDSDFDRRAAQEEGRSYG